MARTINITRTFNAPVEMVWKLWSTEEGIKKWWGPNNFTCPDAHIDFRVGGKFHLSMLSPDGQKFWSGGEYKEIDEHKKIVSSDYFTDENGNYVPASHYKMPGEWPDEMKVTITFTVVGDKTELELIHEGHPDEMADNATQGWSESLDKMAAALE
jgi:uncharacterized protein YndB with AHSA1/START domain